MKFVLDQLVRNNVKGLQPYSSARDEYTHAEANTLFYDANENPFNNGLNRYPDPHQRRLKNKYAQYKGVQPQQLLFGNGSDEVLDLLFRAFCEPGTDEVLVMPPTYGMYKVLAGINHVGLREVALTPQFQIDTKAVVDAIQPHTKIIFVCSPNNPSGNLLAKEAIATLLETFRGLVVVDEAYIDFAHSLSWTTALAQYPNLVVTQTFSKAWGHAGIRLGSCFAAPEIIAVLQKIKPPYNVNQLTQQAALKALEENKLPTEVARLQQEKLLLQNALEPLSIVRKVYPSDANFLLVEVDHALQRYQELIDLGAVVRNRHGQLHCDQCLRITIGTPEENKQLIEKLKAL